ncbi:MAG: hypothetical protein ACI4ED_07255 [Suilimivivens sp.]
MSTLSMLYHREPQMVECGIESLKEWALEGDSKLPFVLAQH